MNDVSNIKLLDPNFWILFYLVFALVARSFATSVASTGWKQYCICPNIPPPPMKIPHFWRNA